MRARALAWKSCVFLCAAAVAAVALGVFDIHPSEARPGSQVSLLVKCDRSKLIPILRDLAGHGAEVWDLEAMKPLSVAPPPPPTEREPTSLVLPDAVRCMTQIYSALSSVEREKLGGFFQIHEMSIQERRATMRCVAADQTAFDEVRRLLTMNAYLQARAREPGRAVEPGAMQKLPDGRWKQAFSMRFKEDQGSGPRTRSAAKEIPLNVVRKLALEAGMLQQYAGPEQDDPNRAKGYRTISREFTFASTRLAQLTKFLARLTADPAGLTVIELRWKLADPKERKHPDTVRKPIVKVAVRLRLQD